MTSLKQLRELNIREQAKANEEINPPPAPLDTSVDADLRTYGLTEARTDGSKDVLTEVGQEARTGFLPHGRTDSINDSDLRERVRFALAKKADLPGGVKSTADMSPELNRRARQYSIDHNNVSIRQMLLVLLDGFLTEEGY